MGAAKGATGVTYEIRTVADFLKVPENRRRICLREFHAWMAIAPTVKDLLCAGGIHPAAITFKADVFRWIDDGKASISVRLSAKRRPGK